jgi:hypothetical protein
LLRVLLQVRESANCLLHVAKQMGCATFLVSTTLANFQQQALELQA